MFLDEQRVGNVEQQSKDEVKVTVDWTVGCRGGGENCPWKVALLEAGLPVTYVGANGWIIWTDHRHTRMPEQMDRSIYRYDYGMMLPPPVSVLVNRRTLEIRDAR